MAIPDLSDLIREQELKRKLLRLTFWMLLGLVGVLFIFSRLLRIGVIPQDLSIPIAFFIVLSAGPIGSISARSIQQRRWMIDLIDKDEVLGCPKCGTELDSGHLSHEHFWANCPNCGWKLAR